MGLFEDESGQTLYECLVAMVIVLIAGLIGFRLVRGMVTHSVRKASIQE